MEENKGTKEIRKENKGITRRMKEKSRGKKETIKEIKEWEKRKEERE